MVDTSLGTVVIDFYGDTIVQITLLGEDGWEVKEGEWGDAELAKGLFYTLGVEEPEANRIEGEVLTEYRSRGGTPRGMWDEGSGKTTLLLVPLVISVIGIFLLGLITLVWIIWRTLS